MRLKFDARARAILKRLPVANIYSVAELVLLAGLAVQCARLLWTILTPISPLGDWRPVRPVVPASALEVLRSFDPFFRSVPGGQPAVVTSLQLKLFGTRMNEAMGGGSAILAVPDGLQRSIAVGEEIVPGVLLKAVAFDHVTIDRGGAQEDLFLDQSGAVTAGAPTADATAGAPAAGVAPVAGGTGIKVGQLQSEIGFIPRLDGGRVSGLVVRPQGSGAAFRAAGLREGDIVTAIGGRPVTGPADLDRVAADFGKGGNLPITVERGGQTLPLAITIQGQ